nr:MAG TPA: hypothetical protein [Microviridae sp.]
MNKYTFIFEIAWRDPQTGRLKPHEYRKKTQMSINDARAYARRLSNIQNVNTVTFYKQMY